MPVEGTLAFALEVRRAEAFSGALVCSARRHAISGGLSMMAEHPTADWQQRLTRLEEAEAFAERQVEQLGSELVEVNRRLMDLANRMQRLEGRLERLMGNITELASRQPDVQAPVPTPPDDPHRPVDERRQA
jgi:chromosome segregation ATPase